MLMLAALAVGALVPLTEGSADARVIPGGRYVGKTSLGANVTVRLSRTGGSFVGASKLGYRGKCTETDGVPLSGVRIRRTRTFSDEVTVVAGAADMLTVNLSGRFSRTGRTITGTFSTQEGNPGVSCGDAGPIRFTARLQRR